MGCGLFDVLGCLFEFVIGLVWLWLVVCFCVWWWVLVGCLFVCCFWWIFGVCDLVLLGVVYLYLGGGLVRIDWWFFGVVGFWGVGLALVVGLDGLFWVGFVFGWGGFLGWFC